MKKGDYVLTEQGAVGQVIQILRWEIGHYIDDRWIAKKNCFVQSAIDYLLAVEQSKIKRVIQTKKFNPVIELGGNSFSFCESSLTVLNKVGIKIRTSEELVYFDLTTELTMLKNFIDILNKKQVKYTLKP